MIGPLRFEITVVPKFSLPVLLVYTVKDSPPSVTKSALYFEA